MVNEQAITPEHNNIMESGNAKINGKTLRLWEYFQKHEMEMFTVQHLYDANQTTILRSRMQVKEHLLPMAILIDKSAYILIQVEMLSKLVPSRRFRRFSRALNDLNNSVRILKFTLSKQGDLMANAVVFAPEGNFDAVLLHSVMMEVLNFLDREYVDMVEAIHTIME